MTDQLVFVPLGGVDEIGMNFSLYGYGPESHRQWLVVDVGVTFPNEKHPGVDLIMADVRYIVENKLDIKGIVITHAHEDHYGALHDLWPLVPVPVWMSPFAAGLLEAKRQSEFDAPKIPVTVYKAGETFEVGPFKIEAIPVAHSIPEPFALAITTGAGTVIHTGDWRIDLTPETGPPTNQARLTELGDAGVLALMCDSTNAMRDGESPSEQAVGRSLHDIISASPGRVAVTTFSSNVGRIRSIAEAARDSGRKVLVMGRSLKRVIDVASELGYMDGIPPFITEDEYSAVPRDKLVIICTGSQGEPQAALARLSRDEFKTVSLTPGDIVIFSSRTIPGNERPILEIKNRLVDMGIRIIEDGDALVHVSGHPRRGELKEMYSWTRPRIGVPVHGEPLQLVAQGSLMAMSGIPQVVQVRNGDMLRLSPGAAEIIDQVPNGRLYKDGRLLGTDETMGVRDRRKLSYAGHVSVNVVLDDRLELAGDPDLVAVGLPSANKQGDDFEEMLLDAVVGAIESIPKQRRKDLDLIQEAVSRTVRSATNEAWGKKPLVTVFVTR